MNMLNGMRAIVISPATLPFSDVFVRCCEALLKAREIAERHGVDKWRYALETSELLQLGLGRTDIQDLLNRGLIECALAANGKGRRIKVANPANVPFDRKLYFILSRNGALAAERIAAGAIQSNVANPLQIITKPIWNQRMRQLHFCELLVKEFRQPAMNQQLLIESFEEQGWASCIDDPLPRKSAQCPKVRLHDAIKYLNRSQVNPLLRFRGDGSGQRVIWCPR